LQAEDTKEADSKTIGIEQDLYDLLIDLQTKHGKCEKNDFVFLSLTGLQIGRNFFGSEFRKYADEAGFVGLVCHDFRHCYTVRKRKEGFDKSVIKAQTGHHTDHMFTWYNKVDRSEIQEMAGFSNVDSEFLLEDLNRLVERGKEKGIPLGVVQSLITKSWKTAAKEMPKM
jgi:integrase